MGVAAALGAAAIGMGAYQSYQQNKQLKEAQKQQEAAVRAQEEALTRKGPEAVSVTDNSQTQEINRLNRLRAGLLGNIKAGSTGLLTRANTASTALGGVGSKTTLG